MTVAGPRLQHRLPLAALAAVALAMLFAAAGARAEYDPVGGGTTKLKLDRGFLAAMEKEKVELRAVAPAKLSGRTVTFPAGSGKFDAVGARGTVEHGGALLLIAGPKRIPIKALKLRTSQKRAPFLAKVGGSQLKIGTTRSVRVSRQGFNDRVRVSTMTLTEKVATRLGKKLKRQNLFETGRRFASSVSETSPATVSLQARGSISLALAAGFSGKLSALFVAVNPVFPGEHTGAPFTFPIATGDMALDASSGRIATQGSIEFIQLAQRQVFWNEPVLDLGPSSLSSALEVKPSPPFRGQVESALIGPAALTAPAAANSSARTIAVNQTLTMDAATAATFNETFAAPLGKADAFKAGETIGALGFVASGQ
jgi:hypothetical protein